MFSVVMHHVTAGDSKPGLCLRKFVSSTDYVLVREICGKLVSKEFNVEIFYAFNAVSKQKVG